MKYLLIFTAFLITACAQHPMGQMGSSAQTIYEESYRMMTATQLCQAISEAQNSSFNREGNMYKSVMTRRISAARAGLVRKGKPTDYCRNPSRYDAIARENASWDKKEYDIDGLKITKATSKYDSSCVSGKRHKITLKGAIGPDSSFAMDRLLAESQPCAKRGGLAISPIEVTLESGGGYLEDGYKLGKVFRDRGVKTIISDNKMCASSCAVAFLGGKKRYVAAKGSILFHAPYLKQMQLEGKERITCDLPKDELQALNDYYSSMTSVEVGDRLFERTMWYCSADNGWTVTGGNAAKLYGIATE